MSDPAMIYRGQRVPVDPGLLEEIERLSDAQREALIDWLTLGQDDGDDDGSRPA